MRLVARATRQAHEIPDFVTNSSYEFEAILAVTHVTIKLWKILSSPHAARHTDALMIPSEQFEVTNEPRCPTTRLFAEYG
jgi:hypothetical protein